MISKGLANMTLRLGEKGAKGWFYNRVGVDIFIYYTIKWVRSHLEEVLKIQGVS